MALNIVVAKRKKGHFLIKLEGRLDTQTAPDCEAKLKPLLTASTQSLVLDMTHLDYISSMGLRVILATRRNLEKSKGKLLMTNMQAPIAKVFEITKIMPGTDIFESVQSADIYLEAIQRREKLKNQDLSE